MRSIPILLIAIAALMSLASCKHRAAPALEGDMVTAAIRQALGDVGSKPFYMGIDGLVVPEEVWDRLREQFPGMRQREVTTPQSEPFADDASWVIITHVQFFSADLADLSVTGGRGRLAEWGQAVRLIRRDGKWTAQSLQSVVY